MLVKEKSGIKKIYCLLKMTQTSNVAVLLPNNSRVIIIQECRKCRISIKEALITYLIHPHILS